MELNQEFVTTLATTVATGVVAVVAIAKKLNRYLSELKPNGGSSLHDKINQVHKKVGYLEAQLRGRFELDPGGCYLTDEEGKCIWVDRQWLELTGLDKDTAKGDGWITGVHKEDRSRVFEEWQMSCRTSLPFEMEYRTILDIRVSGKSIRLTDRNDNTLGFMGIISETA